MIYFALDFEFNIMVSFRNRVLISIASKAWIKVESGILVPIYMPLKDNSLIFGLKGRFPVSGIFRAGGNSFVC